MEDCHCGSGHPLDACCLPFIKGIAKPATALALMRSRYTAYVLIEIDYLISTTHPSTRKYYNPASIRNWALSSQWLRLEIVSTKSGLAGDKKGFVEFKAFYLDAHLQAQIHHEYSSFLFEKGAWYFVDGKVT